MLKKLGRYLFRYKFLLFGVLILMTFVAILSGFTIGMITPIVSSLFGSNYASSGPLIFRWLIEWIQQGDKFKTLIKLAVSIIIIYGIKFPLSLLLYYLSDYLEQRSIADIRVDMFERLTNLSYRYHSKMKSGELLNKITNDTEKIRFALRRGVIHLGQNIFLLVVYLALAFWASWRLFILALILTPFTLWIIQFIGKKVRSKFTSLRKERAFLNAMASEMLQGIKIIKSFGMQRYELDRFKKANINYRKNYVKSHLLKAFLPVSSEFMGAVLAGGILILGGILIYRGVITPDKFLIFLGSIILVQQPVRQLNLAYGDLQHGLTSMESALEVIEATDVIDDSGKENLKCLKKEIRLKNVSFKYDDEKSILKNINLQIKKGETIALVGPSGGGKTTLINLILRFFDPTSGVVEIDGRDIRNFSLDSLRKKIGIVTQDVILFNDSVRNNILYGNSTAKESRIKESINKSHLKSFVEELGNGLETIIGEKGARISGGEKQRIAIARAILKDPPILIFDEATSSLDTESEKLVQDAMNELLKGRTTIIIAHRLSTVRNVNRIVVLRKGEIVEEGSHRELLAKNGLYARFYKLQFKE